MLSKSSSNGLFIVIFIFNLPLFEQTSDQDRKYVYVPTKMTWNLAQNYCREHHTDLATFRNQEELSALQTLCRWYNWCWIGLRRDKNNYTVWNWSDGETSKFRKSFTEHHTDVGGTERCVVTRLLHFRCDQKLAFLCYDNLILVKENKTWEEALEHCRNLEMNSTSSNTYFHPHFDLPHMDFRDRNLVDKETVQDSQTPEVWIGLRFLAGEWLWVNGMPLTEPLEACPAPWMYCGMMSKTGELLPMGNCVERRNFLCSKRV